MASSKVVDISSYKPHMTGPARCLHCGHEWVAVCPVGVLEIECPECKFLKGAFVSLASPPEYWRCDCGNDLFFVTRAGAQCSKCGVDQEFGEWQP